MMSRFELGEPRLRVWLRFGHLSRTCRYGARVLLSFSPRVVAGIKHERKLISVLFMDPFTPPLSPPGCTCRDHTLDFFSLHQHPNLSWPTTNFQPIWSLFLTGLDEGDSLCGFSLSLLVAFQWRSSSCKPILRPRPFVVCLFCF